MNHSLMVRFGTILFYNIIHLPADEDSDYNNSNKRMHLKIVSKKVQQLV